MKKQKPKLLKLYLSFHFNKIFCILLSIIFILWIVILLLNANIPLKLDDYIVNVERYHRYYYEQSFFFLNMINGVVVAFLVGIEVTTESKFDTLFVSHISRPKIVITRIISNMILLLFIVSYEIILMNVVGTFVFPNFTYDINELLLIPYSMIPLVMLLIIGEFITLILSNYFIPVLIFIIHLVFIILMQNEEVYNIGKMFIPQINFIDVIKPILDGNLLLYFGMIGVFIMLIFLIYQKKDIKQI